MVLEAAKTARMRLVLLSGWAGLKPGMLSQDVIALSGVPHSWLYPRCKAVVHHGGAGTCAAALRSGVPQAIVWHLGDQKTWGKLMKLRGVAPPAIFHRQFSSAWLADTVSRLSDGALRSAARRLSDEISREDGVGQAVEAIQRL